MYDLKTGTVRSEVNVSNGVCSVEFDRKDISMNKFVATCLESQFVIFDGRTYNASDGFASLTCYTKQKTTVWAIRHLPQDRDVMAILLGDGTVGLHEYEDAQLAEVKSPPMVRRRASLANCITSIRNIFHRSQSTPGIGIPRKKDSQYVRDSISTSELCWFECEKYNVFNQYNKVTQSSPSESCLFSVITFIN